LHLCFYTKLTTYPAHVRLLVVVLDEVYTVPPPRRRKGHRNRLVRCQNGSLLRRPKISRKGIRCASVRGTEESLRLVSRWGSSLRSGVPLDLIISQLVTIITLTLQYLWARDLIRWITTRRMVPVHCHVHGHVHGHARKHGRLLTEPLIAQAPSVSPWRQQHLRVVEMLLSVILLRRTLSRMHHRVFKRQQNVGHIRCRLLIVA
jgi:hypothetical protein